MPALLISALAACLSAAPTTVTPKVTPFHAIEIESGLEATVTRGLSSVTLEGPAEALAQVETRVDADGVLHVGVKTGFFSIFKNRGHISVAIATPTLDSIGGSGGAIITAVMSPAEQCAIQGSGGTHLTVSSIACDALKVELSGGSQLAGTGHTRALKVDASGGSHAGLREVPANVVKLSASGGSEVRTFASAELKANISGGSDLYLAGHPAARQVQTSGGAQVVDID